MATARMEPAIRKSEPGHGKRRFPPTDIHIHQSWNRAQIEHGVGVQEEQILTHRRLCAGIARATESDIAGFFDNTNFRRLLAN